MEHDIWQAFAAAWQLTEIQLAQFRRYFELLLEANKQFNLTTITDEHEVLAYHFDDSLFLTNFFPVASCRGVLDVGTGAGFPGIPLAIKYPKLPILLMEVTEKKRVFLAHVCKELGLHTVSITDKDWRNFLRQEPMQSIDLICARASLRPDELLYALKPSSPYRTATIVYWASRDYVLSEAEEKFLSRDEQYQVGDRTRRYLFFNARAEY